MKQDLPIQGRTTLKAKTLKARLNSLAVVAGQQTITAKSTGIIRSFKPASELHPNWENKEWKCC